MLYYVHSFPSEGLGHAGTTEEDRDKRDEMTHVQQYLAWLERHRTRDVIKLVTGVRGCGKSSLLDAYADYLKEHEVPAANILRINLEHPESRRLHTPEDLMDYVDEHAAAAGITHLLLDEIHELEEFDVALGGLFALKRYNVIATCSNNRPVSERFGEYLSGMYVHAEMTPTPFRELPAGRNATFEQRLDDYLRFGALPYTFKLRASPRDAEIYLGGLWNTILVKDILSRNRMADSRLVERLLERIYFRLGEGESLRKIGADAVMDGRETAPNTVESYLQALDESMLVRRAFKYDVFMGELAKSGYRFFLADLALGRNRYGNFPGAEANAIRNLIFLELIQRGGAVHCGRYDGVDFDFVVRRDGRLHCWQYVPMVVKDRIPTPALAAFKRMPRDIPKTIIVRQHLPKRQPPGMDVVTLEDFLMAPTRGQATPPQEGSR